jgi:hypothetical protein
MSTANPASRRELHYASLDEFQVDVERLALGKFRTVGKWSYSQILDHLAKTMICSLDGYGFKAPWFVRVILAPLFKNSFLTMPMKAGFKLPEKMAGALLPASDLSLPAALDRIRTAISRCKNETPAADHPAFGKLASQEWNSLYLRHAELHMSFVVLEGS